MARLVSVKLTRFGREYLVGERLHTTRTHTHTRAITNRVLCNAYLRVSCGDRRGAHEIGDCFEAAHHHHALGSRLRERSMNHTRHTTRVGTHRRHDVAQGELSLRQRLRQDTA
jgi:hypothetical protein